MRILLRSTVSRFRHGTGSNNHSEYGMELTVAFESWALVRLFCLWVCGRVCGWSGDVNEDPIAFGASWFCGDWDTCLVDAEVVVFVEAWWEALCEGWVGAFGCVIGASIIDGVRTDGVDGVPC